MDLTDTTRNTVSMSYRLKSQRDFYTFVEGLNIHTAKGPVRFMHIIEQFQEDTFKALSPSLHSVRDGQIPERKRFWIERTKKAGKDSDLAVCILWLMCFPVRPLKCQICAADREQAGIVRERVLDLIHWNPWLNDYVEVRQNRIVNKEMASVVWAKIEATDARGGAHGGTPNVLILNELVHVAKWESVEHHMSNADGTPNSLVIISTNAGIKGTKAWTWRTNALSNRERWSVHLWSKTSPWLSYEDVADAKRRDPIGSQFQRLFHGLWISGSGGAVSEADINAAFVMDGPVVIARPGMIYLGGLDLGVSHDHSGIAVLEVDKEARRVRVANIAGFAPTLPNESGGLEVNAADVEAKCVELSKLYKIAWFGFDPAAGGSFMSQSLRRSQVPMRAVPFTPSSMNSMAGAFVQFMKEGRLECYEDRDGRLRRDFGKFRIENRPTGYKLEAVSDDQGHADVGMAVVIALQHAKAMLDGEGSEWWTDQDVAAYGDVEERPLSDNEVQGMPDDLRQIVEMEGDFHRSHRHRPSIYEESVLAELYDDEEND